ncbi:MAG TPA: hypothetical protein VF522_18295 [Ramlibacter sp.]|uniref:hypothetical protein n=1 Tax=Ramlibacter sp. TaxID=1917967 RepID=UPI002ED24ECA
MEKLTASIDRAIGRNLVALQQVEAILRSIVTHSEHSGLISQFEKLRRQRIKQFGKKGLGELAQRFGAWVLTSGEAVPSDTNEPETLIEPFCRYPISAANGA